MKRTTTYYRILGAYHVSVWEVDGRWLSSTETKIEFLPGPHVTRVALTWDALGFWQIGSVIITSHAEAGHKYRPGARKLEGGRWTVWIEDEATGAVVGGTKEESTTVLADTSVSEGQYGRDAEQRAMMLLLQGQFDEAIKVAKEALSTAEKDLGPDHPQVAEFLMLLATVYKTQGRHGEAEPLIKRTREITEKVRWPEDISVATTLSRLADLFRSFVRYSEAETLAKRALNMAEKERGPEHLVVADALNGLAELYRAQGKYDEAEPLYKRSLDIREKTLGPEHPKVAETLENLAPFGRA